MIAQLPGEARAGRWAGLAGRGLPPAAYPNTISIAPRHWTRSDVNSWRLLEEVYDGTTGDDEYTRGLAITGWLDTATIYCAFPTYIYSSELSGYRFDDIALLKEFRN
ncbi:hypothetical protein J6590_037334 [Homalodisca vitripennis]|nr:hypothetical protein J6590_037334 [Homalodisca vitripennis]